MAKRITKAQLVEKLTALQAETDHEGAHYDADELLLAYINDQAVSEAFEGLTRWYA